MVTFQNARCLITEEDGGKRLTVQIRGEKLGPWFRASLVFALAMFAWYFLRDLSPIVFRGESPELGGFLSLLASGSCILIAAATIGVGYWQLERLTLLGGTLVIEKRPSILRGRGAVALHDIYDVQLVNDFANQRLVLPTTEAVHILTKEGAIGFGDSLSDSDARVVHQHITGYIETQRVRAS